MIERIAKKLGLHLQTDKQGKHYFIINDYVEMESFVVFPNIFRRGKYTVKWWGDPSRYNKTYRFMENEDELLNWCNGILFKNEKMRGK